MRVLRIGYQEEDVEFVNITGDLESFQKLVGGYIEPCAPLELQMEGIELLANEVGLLKHLPYNENMSPFFFVGDLVAVGVGGEEFISLTPDQCDFLTQWLGYLGD